MHLGFFSRKMFFRFLRLRCLRFALSLPENLKSTIQDCRIIQYHQTTIGSWLDMDTATVAFLKVLSPKIVTDSFYRNAQLISDAMRTPIRQTVFNSSQFIK